MLGLRFPSHPELQKPWLTDGTAEWLWPAAERAGIPVMIFPPGSIPAVDRIAERHPGLKLVIDHLAIGTAKKDDAAFAELPELCRLARRPNVAVKASALPCYSTEPYPFRGLHKHIRQVYDAFGPRRMFWGTDWTRLTCPWRQAVTLFTEELPCCTASRPRRGVPKTSKGWGSPNCAESARVGIWPRGGRSMRRPFRPLPAGGARGLGKSPPTPPPAPSPPPPPPPVSGRWPS